MKQDFRPEDIATVLRWLVSIDAALAFAAFALLLVFSTDRRRPRPESLAEHALPVALGLLLAAVDTLVLSSNDLLPPELAARVTRGAAAHGWGPLCAGLGLPVPSDPYPETNSSADFVKRHAERDAATAAANQGKSP